MYKRCLVRRPESQRELNLAQETNVSWDYVVFVHLVGCKSCVTVALIN